MLYSTLEYKTYLQNKFMFATIQFGGQAQAYDRRLQRQHCRSSQNDNLPSPNTLDDHSVEAQVKPSSLSSLLSSSIALAAIASIIATRTN
jgi:hypothetical protein